jgi:Flp pilus assembly protein TadG
VLVNSFRRRRSASRGQALVEFALVAPIFFLLVFSIIQLGLVFGAQNGLVDGVRSAARRAATYRINEGSFDATVWGGICATIEQEVTDRLSGAQGQDLVVGFTPANLNTDITYTFEPDPEGTWFLVAEITATYRNQLYVPLVSNFLDGSDGSNDGFLTLTASEQMRVENPPLDLPTTFSKACP